MTEATLLGLPKSIYYCGKDMAKKAFVGESRSLFSGGKLYLENIGKSVGFEELWLIQECHPYLL